MFSEVLIEVYADWMNCDRNTKINPWMTTKVLFSRFYFRRSLSHFLSACFLLLFLFKILKTRIISSRHRWQWRIYKIRVFSFVSLKVEICYGVADAGDHCISLYLFKKMIIKVISAKYFVNSSNFERKRVWMSIFHSWTERISTIDF